MHSTDDQTEALFSYLSPDALVPPDHLLRAIRFVLLSGSTSTNASCRMVCTPTNTREDIALLIEQRFGKHYHSASLSKVLRRMGFSRQKARQVHPSFDPKAQAAWVKKGCRAR